ncbi:PREDICTED: uncharacterized protein LOC101295501 [Fragaria vesca subsp. vesca]
MQLGGVFLLALATTGISVGFIFLGRDLYNAIAIKELGPRAVHEAISVLLGCLFAVLYTLTLAGLPRREGVVICVYYLKTGTRKYGASCRFDHPPPGEVVAMAASQAKSDSTGGKA